MFKLAIFLFFVCCLSAGNSLKLKSLCNDRMTRDGSHKVNSYYRLKLTENLREIGDYLPKANQDEKLRFSSNVLAFDSRFKKIVKEIYSEKFMNSSQLPDKIREKQSLLVSLRESFRSRSSYNRYNDESLPSTMYDYITGVEYLLGNITQLSDNNLTLAFLPYDRLRTNLGTLLENGLEENQTSTFKDEFIDVFYEKQVATLDGFKIHREDQSIYLDESSYGVVHFSLYVPFYDLNKSQNIKSNCSCTDFLPKFFSVETVPVERNRTESNESD